MDTIHYLGVFMNQENRIVWIAALVQFVNLVDFMMVMPLGPDLAQSLPITNAHIGIICGCYTLAVGISGIVCAKFLDAFDRRSVALITVLGLAIGTVSATFASDIYTLVAARILAGIFGGPAAAIALSMVADTVPPQKRGRAMAIVMGSFSISSIIAIPFGLELARFGNWKTPFYAIFVLSCFVLLLIFFFTPSMKEHLNHKKENLSLIKLLKTNHYRYAYIMMFSAMISTYAIIPPLSAYLQLNLSYPRASLSFLYFIGGLITLVLTLIGGRLSDRIGTLKTNIIGTLFYVLFLCDGFLHQPLSSILIIFCMFMGMSLLRNVSATTEASKLPQPQERAAFMSLLSSIQHLGNGVGAFVASAILTTNINGQLVNMHWVVSISILLAFVQPLCLLIIRNRAKQEILHPIPEIK